MFVQIFRYTKNIDCIRNPTVVRFNSCVVNRWDVKIQNATQEIKIQPRRIEFTPGAWSPLMLVLPPMLVAATASKSG